ncbi:hypothetical protein caldi_13880 [Caldinitratiruptor microaerophilus]|uniref:Uncharacterized protein n=1 Tax=Caldinitratiruptor microaerophilus TaxID=671077 RepID=A0AA35CKW0_9FIRM|nr:hypothetical protein caldi_13880 [Caldinitratiruptor microaerophilus]
MSREDRLPDVDTLTKLLGPGSARAIFSLLEAGAPNVCPGHPWAVAFDGKPHTVAELAAIAGRGLFTMYRDLAKASQKKVLRLVPGPTRAAKILEFALSLPSPSADSATPATPPSEASHRLSPRDHAPIQPVHQPECCATCASALQTLHDQVAALTARLEHTLATAEALLSSLRPTPGTGAYPTSLTYLEAPTAQFETPAPQPPSTHTLAAPAPVLPSDSPEPDARITVPRPTPHAAGLTPSGQAPASEQVGDRLNLGIRPSPVGPPVSSRPQAPAPGASVTGSPTSAPPPPGVRLPEPVLHVFRGIVRRHPTPSEAARIAAHLNRFHAAGADVGDLIHAMCVAEAKYKPSPERPRIECEAFFEKFFHRELLDFLRRRYGRPTPRPFATARRPVPPPSNVFLRRPDRQQLDYESFYALPPASCARAS